MRYWLTLIFGTISVSGILTWLYLRMEAAPFPVIQLQSDEGSLPRLEVPEHNLQGDPKTVALNHEKSQMNVQYRLGVPVANRGPGTLHLTLTRKTCGCIQRVLVDDEPVAEGFPITISTGGQKQVDIVWRYTPEVTRPDQDRLFAVEFTTNDPETPVFRIQVSTHVVR
ncbi:MAG: hypothetical protein RMJ19_09150 [Gemmatales bacterium]|nr:hypothetical protein [Gemmatales bacterium]MCS7160625.1 hypothetical protein [Gemmatales bacterium]MDW8175826.1 hypothetical protein [Gemmatales bacterium]MDW8221950.1 hypothetical protein [Gemmatales bacterium]